MKRSCLGEAKMAYLKVCYSIPYDVAEPIVDKTWMPRTRY